MTKLQGLNNEVRKSTNTPPLPVKSNLHLALDEMASDPGIFTKDTISRKASSGTSLFNSDDLESLDEVIIGNHDDNDSIVL